MCGFNEFFDIPPLRVSEAVLRRCVSNPLILGGGDVFPTEIEGIEEQLRESRERVEWLKKNVDWGDFEF